jgi:hypothetical protein
MARPTTARPRARRRRTPRIRSARTRSRRAATRPSRTSSAPHRFVGRDGSPIQTTYERKPWDGPAAPARSDAPSVRGRSSGTGSPAATASTTPLPPEPLRPTAASAPAPSPPSRPLIALDRPFDLDEFSELLGQSQIGVTVPSEHLAEVLRRVCEFMGFGIYVYRVRFEPAPEELLKSFLVELQRVDYSAESGAWLPFRERGRAESPFGPSESR